MVSHGTVCAGQASPPKGKKLTSSGKRVESDPASLEAPNGDVGFTLGES